MALACTFGLIVCLNYKDERLSQEEVNRISDGCIFVREAPLNSFVYTPDTAETARGYYDMDWLELQGLEFSWKPQNWDSRTQPISVLANFRRTEILRARNEFEKISLYSRNWKKGF